MRHFLASLLIPLTLLSQSSQAASDDISRLYSFSSGTTIQSSQVNGELNQLVTSMNGKAGRTVNNTMSGDNTFSGSNTFSGVTTFSHASSPIKTDIINEYTSSTGVTIDSVLHKDGAIRVPGSAGYAPATNGDIGYDSTSGQFEGYRASTARTFLMDNEGLTPGNSVGYIQPPHLITASTVASSANTLFYIPIYIRPMTAITKIAVEVTSFTSGNARLGIYTNGTNGKPAALLLDAGTISTGTSNGVKEVTVSQTLGGWYWLAYVSDATPTLRAFGTATALLGRTSTSALSESSLAAYSESFSYAALPSTPGTLTAIAAPSNPPILAVR